jgi:hypothetical protein
MAKGTAQKKSDGSALDFEVQFRAAAGQAVPASDCKNTESNAARPEGLSAPKSKWFIKDEPPRAAAAGNRVASGAPVSDPARFKFAASNAPDRRPVLRFVERCRITRNADSFRQDWPPALMADLHPLLTKRAQGRDTSGFSAYE